MSDLEFCPVTEHVLEAVNIYMGFAIHSLHKHIGLTLGAEDEVLHNVVTTIGARKDKDLQLGVLGKLYF